MRQRISECISTRSTRLLICYSGNLTYRNGIRELAKAVETTCVDRLWEPLRRIHRCELRGRCANSGGRGCKMGAWPAPGLGPARCKPASRGDHGSRCQDHASPDRSQQTEQARENQSVPQAGESSTGGQQPECRKHAQEEQRPRAKLRVRGNGPRALGRKADRYGVLGQAGCEADEKRWLAERSDPVRVDGFRRRSRGGCWRSRAEPQAVVRRLDLVVKRTCPHGVENHIAG